MVFAAYTHPNEWVSAATLAERILPMGSSEFSKEVSRKLSNLNRFGHLDRRTNGTRREFEYQRRYDKPVTLPGELALLFRFGPHRRPGDRPPPIRS